MTGPRRRWCEPDCLPAKFPSVRRYDLDHMVSPCEEAGEPRLRFILPQALIKVKPLSPLNVRAPAPDEVDPRAWARFGVDFAGDSRTGDDRNPARARDFIEHDAGPPLRGLPTPPMYRRQTVMGLSLQKSLEFRPNDSTIRFARRKRSR